MLIRRPVEFMEMPHQKRISIISNPLFKSIELFLTMAPPVTKAFTENMRPLFPQDMPSESNAKFSCNDKAPSLSFSNVSESKAGRYCMQDGAR